MTAAELIDRLSQVPPDSEVFLIERPTPGRLDRLPPNARPARQVVRGLDGNVVIGGA